jgi:hypothetical protein
MKLFSQLFALSLLISLYSCSKETDITTEAPAVPTNQTVHTMPQVEDGMLTFSNMESFQKAMVALGSMGMDERTKWEKKNGFESMQTLCETLSYQLLNVETIEEYWQIRSRYENNVFFNEPGGDNQAFDIPLEKMGYLPIVNVDGNVKIAGEVICFKAQNRSLLKAAGDDLAHCKKWRSRDTQILCLVEETGFISNVMGKELKLYISTQKHRWLTGWVNTADTRYVKNESGFMISFSSIEGPLGGPIYYLNSGDALKIEDQKYTNWYFMSGNNLGRFQLRVWGNGFNEANGCVLNF